MTLDAYAAWVKDQIASKSGKPVQSTTVINPPTDYSKGPTMPKLPSEILPTIGDRFGFVIRRDGINRYTVSRITGDFGPGFEHKEIGRIEVKAPTTFTWESAVTEDSGGEASFPLALHKLITIWFLNHKG